jgi:hypothetical protein
MHKFVLLILLIFTTVISAYCRQNSEPANCGKNGISLFDGKSLNGWEITQFGPQGDVYVKDKTLILGTGDGCTGITYKNEFPKMNYEVTLEAKRINGTDFFCGMTFPFNDEFATLIVGGWGGTVVGLSSINGLDASENETGRLKRFDKNIWYSIKLEVKPNGVKVWIDDMLTVDFIKDKRPLSVRSEVLLSCPFGITSWQTKSGLRNICLLKF